ncbi:MAG: response regulator [Clostridia bacterium]|nr:response regulator [Clostridia bacterium]
MEEINYSEAKIIVIDDREEVLESIKDALEFESMKVVTFQNPTEGVEYLKNNTADVLLLDYYMPEMNGGEVITKVRKYNQEIIIILQTGYADKIPPLEMMKQLNIQGYVDKNEGSEKIILAVQSAIKTAQLLKTIKKQEKELDAHQYRDEFFGKFLYRFIGEVRERTMVIGGLIDSITTAKDDITEDELKRYSESVKKATNKLMQIVKTLEIEKISILTVSELNNILNSLFEIYLKMQNGNLNFKYDNENITVNCDIKTIIYILVDIIEFLLNNNEKEINIICEKEEDKLTLKICNKIENIDIIEKINKLSMFDKKLNIINEFNQIKIVID